MPRLALIAVLLAAASCKQDNPQSCELPSNANNVECSDAGTVGGTCKGNGDCVGMSGLPVCDTTGSGRCVQCTTGHTQACPANKPVCTSDLCTACVSDNDCGGAAGVCNIDGSCAAVTDILYVSSSGSGDPSCGTMANPCNLAQALVASPAKPVLKLLDDGPYTSLTQISIARDMTIDARGVSGATLSRTTAGGPIVSISGQRTVTIIGGTFTSNKALNDDGIDSDHSTLTLQGVTISNNGQLAVSSTSGSLTIYQSILNGNKGGGLFVMNGTFTVVGNLFENNGDVNSSIGGLTISTSSNTSNRLDFNTISANKANPANAAPGIQCGVANGFIARNNIIWFNTGESDNSQIAGSCQHAYSDIQQTLAIANDSGNNLNASNGNPMFNPDYTLMLGSPVAQKADPSSDLTGIAAFDLAGKPRTKPADIGAFNVPAQ